jgi:hypothetical protein
VESADLREAGVEKMATVITPARYPTARDCSSPTTVDMVPDYVKAVTTSPDMEAILYREGAGLSVTLKKR